MGYAVEHLAVGSLGVDCVTVITAATAAKLKAAGFSFVVRYLGSLTAAEVQDITGAGLGVMAVCYSRAPGWLPSAALGASDGAAMVAHAKAAGLLPGTNLWIDFEGPSGTAEDQLAYINSCAAVVAASGWIPSLYVGLSALTPEQLYSARVHGYWHSLSEVPNVGTCGYMLVQLYPSTTVAGIDVDIDVSQKDKAGRAPIVQVFVPDAIAQAA